MLWTVSLCLLLCSTGMSLPLSGPGRNSNGGRNKLLLISFDGFRWDYDRDVDTPFLDQMANDGVKAVYVTPAFLTVTSPTHFTILTGRYIENHGVVHNMYFNTTTSEKKSYWQTQFVNEWWDNGTVPIWITAQRQGLKAGSHHFPGTASTYHGEKVQVSEVEPAIYNYSNETVWRTIVDKVMGSWFSDQDLDFVALYFGEPDGMGHKFGPDSPQVKKMVKQVDRTVGYLRNSAKRHGLEDRLNIIITADHGMSTVRRADTVNEIVLSKIPGFSFKDLDFHIVDYGPAGMLLPKEGKLDKVYNALKGAHPHLHVYKREEMPSRLHFSNNKRILPIVLWADPGYLINGYFPVQFNRGEHGFDNEGLDMKPFFRAVGPDFHKNLIVDPFETVNIYPLMCHLLGIMPDEHDGDLNNVRNMVVDIPEPVVKGPSSLFIGLGAVGGVLVLVGLVAVVHNVLQRKKQKKSEPTEYDEDPKETIQSKM